MQTSVVCKPARIECPFSSFAPGRPTYGLSGLASVVVAFLVEKP